MRSFWWCALVVLGACDPGKTDAGTDDGSADTDTIAADTDVLAECVPTHEECAPGVAGCFGEGDFMLPGSNCLACHSPGGLLGAPTWTAGGTIFTDAAGVKAAKNVEIKITDANDQVVTLTSNSSGNFYTGRALAFPIQVDVTKGGVTRSMATAVDEGGCNSCHSCEGAAGGKLFEP